jgi:hypothetical protein
VTDEEAQFKWYTALRFGQVIGEGPTPMPDDVREQATEIRWSMGDAEPPAIEESSPPPTV